MTEEDVANVLTAEGMVGIPIKRYEELLHQEKVLDALYAGGVDNWEWYGESLGELED